MGSVEPSEDQIAQVIEFAGLDPLNDRAMVRQALKSHSGNGEAVIMSYLEDPSSFRYRYSLTWDESMFEADRDGGTNTSGIAFHIESTSQNDGIMSSQGNQGLTAPSRPPSRSSNRSPLTRVADWVETGPQGIRSFTQEEEDMQRALRESAQEAGNSVQEQESGIIDPQITMSAPQFGPATRSAYDAQSWAMVQTQPAESNFNMVPLASKRKRASNVPAFLVQSTDVVPGNRIGAFLTILHAIPLARNKLLQAGEPASSYWYNGEWWNGKDILPPDVLTRLQAGELDNDAPEAIPNFEHEIHRLIAALDQSSRSYASADSLTRIITTPSPVAEYNGSESVEKHFYEMFASRNSDQVHSLYSRVTLESVLDGISQAEDDEDEENTERNASFGLLETEVAKDDLRHTKTLYEVMDHIMWGHALSDGIREDSKMAMYKEFGEILSFKLEGDYPEDGSIAIPEKLYPARWSEDRKPEARKIQAEWYRTKSGLQKLEEAKNKLERLDDSNGGEAKSKEEYLKQQRSRWETYTHFLENRARFRALEESGFDINKYPDYKFAPCQLSEEDQRLHQECQGMVQSIDASLVALEKSKNKLIAQIDQLRAQQRYLGQVLTDPKKDSRRARPLGCKEYLLRGIATSANVVYVCHRDPADLIELDDNAPSRDQWWRLSLNPKAVEPVKAERLSFEEVHDRVWADNRLPLIVYATEAAVETLPLPLIQPLERFIKVDNKAFNQEIALEASEPEEVPVGRRSFEPLSPSKRKHRADSVGSMDSMNSNRASIGSEERNISDPFIDDSISVKVLTGVEPSQASHDSASSNTMDLDVTSEDMQPLLLSEHMEGVRESGQPEPHSTPLEAPAPEMEQRSGIPSLMSKSSATAANGDKSSSLKMDIPDN